MNPPGYRATVTALAAGQLICWAALFYTFSIFVLPMRRELGWTEPAVMGAFTLGLAMWGLGSYGAGAAIDAGRGRLLMTGGAVCAGFGFLVWSQVQALGWLYLAWALLGAAMPMLLYDPAFNILAKRFPARYRDGITSLTLVGGFASTLAFPATTWLIAGWGWRAALATIGAVLLLLVVPLHAWALRGAGQVTPHARDDPADDATLHQALRERAFWLLTLTFTLYQFASAALFAHLMPAFASKGQTESQALAVVVWFGPAQVAGRFAWLGFGRWVSPQRLGLVVLAAMPVSLAIFALADHTAALLVFSVLFGIANGLVTIVRGNLVPEFFGRQHVGRISGAMTGISLFARACAPLLTAWLLVALGGYRQMLLTLAAIGTVAVVAFALARKPGS